MINNILTANRHTIADIADSCGINWNELSNTITFDGRKVTHNRIAISKAYRGKCFAVGHKWTAKDGNEYPTIVFYTNKHGGQTAVFDGFKEHMAQRGYSDQYIKSQSPPKPIQIITKAPIQALEQWQIDALTAAHLAWNTATTENVSTHPYIISKGVNVEGLEIRRGIGKFGDCLMIQVFNILGCVIGYQQIYDRNVRKAGLKPSNKHFVGQISGGFIVIGDRTKIQHGAWITEGVATGFSIYHADGNGKDTLSNKRNLPVICCLSADNMKKVTQAFTELGNADLRICADNDLSDNGNTGIYTAIQCATIAGAKGYYCPENEGQKCDFNDTLNFKLFGISHCAADQIQQLITVSSTAHLNRLGNRLAFAMAKQVPYLCSEEEAAQIVLDALKTRHFDGKCNAAQIIKHSVSERREIIRKRNNITDFTGLERIKIDAMPDKISREINEIIRRKLINIDNPAIIFDPRSLGAGKTELLELMREFLGNEKISVIIHRVALSYDLSTRLDTDHYKEEEPSSYIRHLTITANSLPKFSIAENGFKILFIDEARQVLDHLIHGTVSNRQAAFNEFVAAVEAADFIICSDADMNDATVAFFKKHANGKKLHVIDAPAGINNKILHMVDDHATNFVNISEALNAGQNVFVGCTSKDKAIEAYTFAIDNAIDFTADDLLLIHSGNKEDEKQAAFLKNPNAESIKYRAIFHSPTIGSGVSITTPHFISNYFLNSGNLPENECLQMTARNRCATNIFVSCGEQKNVTLMTDIALMTEGEGKKAECYLGQFDGAGFAPNELGLLRIELNAVNNHALNDYANNFYLLAEINGYTINRTPFDASVTMTTEIIESKTKGLGKRVKEATCERIKQSDTNTTKKTLSKHKQNERDQLDKLATINMAGTSDIDTDDIYRFKFKNVLPVLLNHENLYSAKSSRLAWDRVNHVTQDKSFSKSSLHKLSFTVIVKGIAAPTIKNKTRRKRWLELVLKADSMRAMQAVNKRLSKARLDTRQAAKLCQYLKANAPEIAANGLGNYDREFQRPMQILGSFIQHFGYENIEVFKSNGKHLYAVQPIDYIERYATNRAGLKEPFSGQ
jgi:phage/plasmid primase-like uncharacterized protein